MTFTEPELTFLSSQPLGRLATVAPNGAPQNNPVAFTFNATENTLDIFGLAMGATKKFRNVQGNPHVSLVVDEIVSFNPWDVRGIEIRGEAEALDDVEPSMSSMSRQAIRIHPARIISWNLNAEESGMRGRDVVGGLR